MMFSIIADIYENKPKMRFFYGFILPVLFVLGFVVRCIGMTSTTKACWPLFLFFIVCIMTRVLLRKTENWLMFGLFFLGALTLIPWSRNVYKNESSLSVKQRIVLNETFVGKKAVVVERINPPALGKIKINDTNALWNAFSATPLEPGVTVTVKSGILEGTNLTLIVTH